MASTRLDRTNGSPTNGQKGTFSTWVRVDKVAAQKIMINYLNSENYSYIRFHPSKFLQCYATLSNSVVNNYKTERSFVDFNGWYHIVARIDTTQATATDRLRLYVNGELQTAYDTQTYSGSQNAQHPILIASATNTHRIGADENPADYFSGLMSHFHFCDGYSYDASAFGSTDATTGEWKINTSPSVTYGNNGYFILKDGNSVTDQSGQGNNFTVAGGTLTKTEDCPDNVFATINSLVPSDIASLSKGNTTLRQSDQASAIATLGFQGGKYYWEVKNSNQQSYTQIVGVLRQARMEVSGNDGYNVGTNDGSWGYFMQSNQDNGKSFHNNSLGSVYQTTSVNDILQVAVDGDAGKIWWGVNGTWVNSGDPANGTNAVYTNLPTDDVLFPAFSNYTAGQFQINFGNGYFGTTAVSSAGTNASGNGIFEYDVPTGFTALSTKGLNL